MLEIDPPIVLLPPAAPSRLSRGGHAIAECASYVLETALVANIRSPQLRGTRTFETDDCSAFRVGDRIELRNEFRFGRANFPKRHAATIVEASDTTLTIEPALPDDTFADQRGSIIHRVVRETLSPSPQLIESERSVLGGASNTVRMLLEAEQIDRDAMSIRIRRTFLRDCLVEREHLTLDMLGRIVGVFRKNRRLDESAFQTDYWLDDQGFAVESGPDEHLLIYGQRDVAALELHAAIRFRLEAISSFREHPFGVDAMLDRDVTRYASASHRMGKSSFRAVMDEETIVTGVRIVWHRTDTRASWVRIIARDDAGRVTGDVQSDTPAVSTFSLRFTRPVECRTVEVHAGAGSNGNFTARYFDVLRDGSRYGAEIVLDDRNLHRHYTVTGPAPVAAGFGGAVMLCEHWFRKRAGQTESNELRLRWIPRHATRSMPRVMHIPNGAESAIVITEHADNTSLESHRAVCFGSSDITDPAHATGGFVGHRIPVTKTVFYANPNHRPILGADGDQASLIDTEGMEQFCKSLASIGFDIGLHSPQPDNSTREMNERAIRQVSTIFGLTTWIDHSCSVVHNGLSALGAIPDQPHYVLDLLHECDVRFAWTFASEDASELYLSGLSIQQVRAGDWTKTPLLWTHQQRLPGMYVWPSSAGSDFGILNPAELDELEADFGVAVTHSYPAYYYKPPRESPYFTRSPSGPIRTTPEFETVLTEIERRQDRGTIVALTVREWANHLLRIRDVSVNWHNGRGWAVEFPGDDRTDGQITLAVPRSALVQADDASRKSAGDDDLVTVSAGPGRTIVVPAERNS